MPPPAPRPTRPATDPDDRNRPNQPDTGPAPRETRGDLTMSYVTDEIRKTLTDPKPLYALAGAGDLAAEKLRDAPTLLAEAAGTVTTLATRLAAEAPERLAK